jgi:hypothetical protein
VGPLQMIRRGQFRLAKSAGVMSMQAPRNAVRLTKTARITV